MKRFLLCILIVVLTVASTLPVLAETLSQVQQDKKNVDKKLIEVKAEKKQTEELKKQLEKDKEYLEAVQAKENELYEELLNDYKQIEEDIRKIDEAIKESEENLKKQDELFKTRLRVMYKNSNTSGLEGLFESKSITEAIEKIKYISFISKLDREIVEDLKIAKADVEYKKQLKEEAKKQKEREIDEKEERLENLRLTSRSVAERMNEATATLKRLEKLEDELLKESRELTKKINELAKRQTYVGGSMVWPLPSNHTVGSGFGMRMHPILKVKKMHTGIDIGGKTGASIVAANTGTVILAGYTSGYGNRVVIDHGDGITTLYAHCSKILVKVGDEVKAGQTIAKVGSTGLATGPHLHFEVRVKGEPVDPLKGYLSK
ncbi:MAG TPA: peptidoglycan DD-metalloendopeptidase family protein [Clostridiaceae bacterium]|nr:peptidoglycan DD-metalloendopeptidase family protein [Clostridiaceae bacterium]